MAKETKPAKETKKTAAPKVKMETKNGVTRPKPGTQTGRVWEVSDTLSKKAGKPVERSVVMTTCEKEGLNKATIATQYGKWRKFNGLVSVRAKAKPAAPAAPVKK